MASANALPIRALAFRGSYDILVFGHTLPAIEKHAAVGE